MFTNDESELIKVRSFYMDAMGDGWKARPTYANESIERAATLEREGFKIQIIARDDSEKKQKYRFDCSIHAWGPDGMCVEVPDEYDFEALELALTHCENCGEYGIVPHRYSFAGRCCMNCLPGLKKQHEYPGWDR